MPTNGCSPPPRVRIPTDCKSGSGSTWAKAHISKKQVASIKMTTSENRVGLTGKLRATVLYSCAQALQAYRYRTDTGGQNLKSALYLRVIKPLYETAGLHFYLSKTPRVRDG